MVRLKVQEDNIKLKMNAPDGAAFRTNEYTPIISGSSDYNDLDNKPSINGNTLEGDMTTEDLGIHIPEDVSELNNDEGFIKSPNVVYCTCDTGGGTAAKVATIVSGTLTSLQAGDQAIVKFTNSNTVANPTLKIGDTDAKPIKRYGTTAPSTSVATSWNAGNAFLFVYDGTNWMLVSWLNTAYSEITEANITNGTGSATGLISGRRAKKAVETFAPVNDVTVDGESVVNGGVAEIPKIPTAFSDLTNDEGYFHLIDLGDVDGDEYDWDFESYMTEITDPGFYHFVFGDEMGIYFYVERQEFGSVTLVLQRYWTSEEGPRYMYYRSMWLEDGELVESFTDAYMTFSDANSAFANAYHSHILSASGTQTVWQYCNGSNIQYQSQYPMISYRDNNLRKQYIIEVYAANGNPIYRFMRVTDLSDGTCFYQRSGTFSGGQMTWGDWYKFSGSVFDPSGR